MGEQQDQPGERESWDTTLHVRRAADGDTVSLGRVVARLSPLLLATAEYRLGAALRAHVDPEDLVNDAWIAALPKLSELQAREGRMTPVLLKYLTTTINFRINHLLRKRATGALRSGDDGEQISQVPAEASGAVTRAVRQEQRDTVRACLEELAPRDREIILLRGIEQNSSKTVAVLLGLSPQTVDQRFSRALKRLRSRLPESVFEELDDA